jgi:hypothetical protein
VAAVRASPSCLGVRVSQVSGVSLVSEFGRGGGGEGSLSRVFAFTDTASHQIVGITDYRYGRPEWTRTIDLLRVREAL